MSWTVLLHPLAKKELAALTVQEKGAVDNAMKKLEALGPDLGYPHSSAVQASDRIRELRPRSGRSQWRAFYRRIGDVFLVGAVGPEAQVDPRKFDKAVRAAEKRINDVEANS
jgi:hypothetical protein